MSFNPFKVSEYQLYLLQLENYELDRFFKLLFKKGLLPKPGQRKNLVFTVKVRLLLGMAAVIQIVIAVLLARQAQNSYVELVIFLLVMFVLYYFSFVLYTLSLILIWPIDFVAKRIIIARAKSKILNLKSKIKIIGIAGSYGKTTMKEVLGEVLSAKFKVLRTPESVNTPVGIGRWMLKNFRSSGTRTQNTLSVVKATSPPEGEKNIEIAIIEMGEHYKGDVAQICKIVQPDIAVVTGINQAHLERMKNLNTVVDTIFEIVANAKPDAAVLLNQDDKNVVGNYKKFIQPQQKAEFYGVKSEEVRGKVGEEGLGWEMEIANVGKAFVKLLGEYALADVDAAVKIAKKLGASGSDIIAGLQMIRPVEHRLQPIKSAGDILVIDDAYNGNPEGVAEAIKVLSRFTNRRKIFITPGLVEMGSSAAEVHREIGRQLAGVADVVILIRDSVTSYIEEGMREISNIQYPISKPAIIWFNTAQDAHAGLAGIVKSGDVVLFQNDWGDQYI